MAWFGGGIDALLGSARATRRGGKWFAAAQALARLEADLMKGGYGMGGGLGGRGWRRWERGEEIECEEVVERCLRCLVMGCVQW